jgi:hypothetical protein
MWSHIATVENLYLERRIRYPLTFQNFKIYSQEKSPFRKKVEQYLRDRSLPVTFTHVLVMRTRKTAKTNGEFINRARIYFNRFIMLLRVYKPNWAFIHYEFFHSKSGFTVFTLHESDERPHFLTIPAEITIKKTDIGAIKRILYRLKRLRSRERFNKILNSLGYLERGCKGILAERIIWLFIVLESLLNLKEPELAHKLSSRTAWLINPTNFRKRIEVFNGMKKAYGFRSNIVHGEVIKQKEIESHLKFLEDKVWALMKTILLDLKLLRILTDKREKTQEYFNNLVLGKVDLRS